MTIKLGVSTLSATNMEEFLYECSNLGVKYIEIVKSYPNHDIDYELIQSYDFKYSIHSPLIDMNIASLTDSIREASVNELKKSIDDAIKINTTNVVVHPGKISFLGQPYEDYIYKLCINSFKQIKEYSENTGVNPLIENMPVIPGFMYTDLKKLENTLENLDMYMTLDIGHAYTAEFNENDMYSPRVKHIHIHDNNGDDDSHLPLGEGSIQFNTIIDKYTKENYDGIYILEANNIDSVKKSIKYLKQNKYIK